MPSPEMPDADIATGPPRRLVTPRGDREFLFDPPPDKWRALTDRNRRLFAEGPPIVLSRPLSELRAEARRQILEAARRHAQEVGDAASDGDGAESALEDRPWIASGHQPALFHPGVWAKNFVVDRLARDVHGTGLHLLIDNDLCTTRSVHVPVEEHGTLHRGLLPFDSDGPRAPWEECRIEDPACFASFADRVAAAVHPWGVEPIAQRDWPAALRIAHGTGNLRDALTAVRRAAEARWGVRNREVPWSRACETDAFRRFVVALVADLPRFHAIHNAQLARFRREQRIRSRTHPVPELRRGEGRCEAPFWTWSAGESQRRPVFVESRSDVLVLDDGQSVLATLPSPRVAASCTDDAVALLAALSDRGVRLRSRALTTTLFARWWLADVFVHGLGGAKYDELTDRIAAEFFRAQPPGFVTATGTLQLPLGDASFADRTAVSDLTRQEHDLAVHPERHVPVDGFGPVAELQAAWSRQVEAQHAAERERGPTRGARRAQRAANRTRYQRLQELRTALAAHAEPERAALRRRLAEAQRRLAADAVRRDRDWAFCLHSEESLRSFLAPPTGPLPTAPSASEG